MCIIFKNLRCKIINSETAYADNVGSTYVTSSTGIDFNNNSSDTNGKGLYYTDDVSITDENNDGIGSRIYYYRGAVNNNYIVFANYCWLAIRTTEEGNVKLIYAGTYNNNQCYERGGDYGINKIPYNYFYGDNAYVGYMYGDNSNFTKGVVSENNSIYNIEYFGGKKYAPSYSYDDEYMEYVLSGNIISGNWNTSTVCTSSNCPVKDYYTCSSRFWSTSQCEILLKVLSYNSSIFANISLITTASTSYNQAHSNINNSYAKDIVDTWYANNILTKGQTVISKISDAIYCNDRSIKSGNGYGSSFTSYNGYSTNSFKCLNLNDRFTVGSLGNADLTYPIGLATAVEIRHAGSSFSYGNDTYFLNSGNNCFYSPWTMTPSGFSTDGAGVYQTIADGYGHIGINRCIKPVITLKNNAIVSEGTGTYNNPYIME
jgi:hypothetical protein